MPLDAPVTTASGRYGLVMVEPLLLLLLALPRRCASIRLTAISLALQDSCFERDSIRFPEPRVMGARCVAIHTVLYAAAGRRSGTRRGAPSVTAAPAA